MERKRGFLENGSRYAFDYGMCSTENGFAQFDTSQDASYFGIWVNPFELKIVSYMEGDVTIETAESEQEFCDALRSMRKVYGEGGIDPGFNKDLARRFEELGLGDLLYEECRTTARKKTALRRAISPGA